MNTKRIGNYEVEFPTMCNGHQTQSMGFITPLTSMTKNSQFFIIYSEGRVGFDYPEQVTKAVRNHVMELSARESCKANHPSARNN